MSAFDGIGCARIAAESLAPHLAAPLAYIAWEIEAGCQNLTSRVYEVTHRGDITQENFQGLADILDSVDPDREAVVLLTAGPPCVDFTIIKGDQAPGRDGPEGIKFDIFVQWQRTLKEHLQGRPLRRLVENVLPHRRGDIAHFENTLTCKAVIIDAAIFGKISRPRVWWSDVQWDDKSINEVFGNQTAWKKEFGTWKLTAPQTPEEVFIPQGWKSPTCWQEGKILPCLTTPAPTEAGRRAPKSAQGRMSAQTYHRWVEDSRCFAPWHYNEANMLKDNQDQLRLLPAETKESLHHIPVNYTAGYHEKQRHKWLANSWHVGVARLIIFVLLAQLQLTQGQPIPKPLEPDHTPGLTTMQQLWSGKGPTVGPGHKPIGPSHALETVTDMWEHWSRAICLPNPRQEALHLEEGLRITLTHQHQHQGHLDLLRARVCHDVDTLKEKSAAEIEDWWHDLQPHIQDLYQDKRSCIQVVVIHKLCDMFGWQDPTLLAELTTGFPLLGQINPGLGWPKREDGRYSQPLQPHQFLALNEDYIHQKLERHRADPHWEELLAEIAQDVSRKRMTGPHHGPSTWPTKMQPAAQYAHCQDLLPGPEHHESTSVAFSILQVGSDGRDKVRRGEDWKRGHQNSTVSVNDTPVQHRPDTLVAAAKFIAEHDGQPELWGTDQQDAYRQLPLMRPEESWVILFTPCGPTLWRHNALLFGSTASVWAYCRCADLLCWLSRTLLLVGASHYVDDFATVETSTSSKSSFEASHRLWESLGFQFKTSKRQPPAVTQKIQGISMTCGQREFTLAPDPDRTTRMCTRLEEILQTDELSPDEAMKIAGKLQFMSETLMGQAAKSCLQPVYQRGYMDTTSTKLNEALQDAIKTMLHLLSKLKPKIFHFDYQAPAVIFADAFFQAGDRKIKVSAATTKDYDPDASHLYKNGWGWVAYLPDGKVYYAHGEVPASLVARLTSNGAFIYGLEILSQILALVGLRPLLPDTVWCWCDNTASQSALTKGYGKDRKINRLLAATWSFLAEAEIEPVWRRVTSSANISDPISRQDDGIAKQNSWIQLEAPWTEIYHTLKKCTTSLEEALKVGPKLKSMAGNPPECASMGRVSRTTMVEKHQSREEVMPGATNSSAYSKRSAADPCMKLVSRS